MAQQNNHGEEFGENQQQTCGSVKFTPPLLFQELVINEIIEKGKSVKSQNQL